MPKRERMSTVDAAWLQMEDPTNLMMITGIMVLSAPIDLARFKQVVQERMVDRFPRFRKRIVKSPLPLTPNYWEDDVHFDIDSHIHRIALPAPGDHAALQTLVSDMMSTPLDFSRAPWHMYIVEGYGDGCAVLGRLHHSIADGIALMQVLLSLTDNEPDITVPDAADADNGAAGTVDLMAREMRSVVKTTQKLGESLVDEGLRFLANPSAKLASWTRLGFSGAAALGKVVLLPPDNRTVFSGRLGVRKLAVWSNPIPLPEVKAVSRATGATINDILLTAMAGALGRYFRDNGPLPDDIRAFVPVNLRSFDEPLRMGNKFGLVILSLPVGIAEPAARLQELKRRMDEIKGSPEAVIVYGVLNLLGASGQQIEDMAVEFFGKKATAVMTNVPGPRQQIYLAGAPIETLMFWVPQSGRLGLGVSIFSYNDQVSLGVAVDKGLCDNPTEIVTAFHDEFEMLKAMAADYAAAGAPADGDAAADSVADSPSADSPSADDLTAVKGIGPKIAAILVGHGVKTYAALAALEPATIGAWLDAAEITLRQNLDTWPTQAAALDVIKAARALGVGRGTNGAA